MDLVAVGSENGAIMEKRYAGLTTGSSVARPYRNSIIMHWRQLGHIEFRELKKSAVSDPGHM